MTTKHIALAAALACITTSAQAQVIYLVPGGQFPVVGIAPGPPPGAKRASRVAISSQPCPRNQGQGEGRSQPTAEWIARQLTEACGWDEAPRYLIRDRDRSYSEVFVRRVRAMGIRDRPISPRSPWQNGYAERLIGSIRRECIDHVIVFGECHLHHLLRCYLGYYNETRTHLSLDKDAPVSRAIQSVGLIFGCPVLGGSHHQYVRI